ncbi:hydroxyacid dehydrogenase [Janibacter sp. Soil728]|uniref:D-2-hydroxyacid dehydrogenase n=1 Tax=Janibacter sp. Soil728 TaxID=1736393 RepID=UPI0006FC2F90|nr:D-2-hydroxyacid dehydrogenase [Janibacter sp. Soil728]KRE39233.1 hydroxyacid dehydrogenase [Janibacter sp. Soil728]
MPRQSVVVVLHDGDLPSEQAMAPVLERAHEVRFATAAELPEAIVGADVLFAYDFFSTAIPDAWSAADSLEWLHVASTGVDAILSPQLRESDVVLTNSRGVFDEAIAEYVLGQVVSIAKGLPRSWELQQAHRWVHRESERVAGSRVLVVGTGQIGRAIARLLRAVGMEVSASGRRARTGDPDFGTVTAQEDLHHALAGADWVVCIAPLTDATRGMFDAAAFRAMPDHARFINVGRGESVVTDDLVTALQEGAIAGAALDVLDTEPLPADHPLWDLPDVVITPHSSGDFVGWRDELVRLFADNFTRWVDEEPLRHVVDTSLGYVPTDGSPA